MNKKIIFLLVLCFILSIGSPVYAQDGIDVKLEEPKVTSLVKGEEVTYKIKVDFTKPLEQFSNLFVTLRLSEGLDFKSVKLVGVQPKTGALETIATPNNEGRYGFVTLRLTDIKALNGASEFSIDVVTEVNTVKKDGEKLSNTFTVSFQTHELKTHYYQISQDSTATVSSKKTEQTKPVEQPKSIEQPKPVEQPKPTVNPTPQVSAENTSLDFKSGRVYSYFMDRIEGVTNIGNTIEAKIGEKVETVPVDGSGRFKVVVPTGTNQEIIITAINSAGARGQSSSLRYVDEKTITSEDLQLNIESLKKMGYEDIVNRYLKEFEEYTSTMSLTLGIEGGTRQDTFELFKRLYFATRTLDPQILVHDPFMNGYPEGNFLPKNSITRAETAAILSRIIAGGEVADKNSKFPDVPNGKWYTKYIAHLEELGIMKGYDDGKFIPTNKITRAEFATIISRQYKLTESELIQFKDLNYNHWTADDIMKVATAGIMEGYPDKTFGHTLAVTRAEAATIINRALNRIPDKEYIDKYNITNFTDVKGHWAYYQIIEATTRHEYVMDKGVEKYRSHP